MVLDAEHLDDLESGVRKKLHATGCHFWDEVISTLGEGRKCHHTPFAVGPVEDREKLGRSEELPDNPVCEQVNLNLG